MYTGWLAHARTFSGKAEIRRREAPRVTVWTSAAEEACLAGRRGVNLGRRMRRDAPIVPGDCHGLAHPSAGVARPPRRHRVPVRRDAGAAARGGLSPDAGDDDARRLRQRRARRRGDRRDPQGRGAGGGRPDRGRLPLPGVPRPGHLQRRRVASAGHRGPAAGPARPHPDRAAGRLPVRPRDDQPAGPRRLLHRPAAQLRDPAVGARPAPGARSPTSITSTPSRARTATAGRSRRASTSTCRASSSSSGRCSPATPASATGSCGSTASTNTSTARQNWGAHRGAEIGVAQAEAFRQYLGHPYPHDNLLLSLVGQDGRGGPAPSS